MARNFHPCCLRLLQELRTFGKDAPWGCTAQPLSDSDLQCWHGLIAGPPGSVWEHGLYPLVIEFPDNYPLEPPSVSFLCSVFHPNIFEDGRVCLDILSRGQWSPAYQLSTLLVSIQSVLADPICTDAANGCAADVFTNHRQTYDRIVREQAEATLQT